MKLKKAELKKYLKELKKFVEKMETYTASFDDDGTNPDPPRPPKPPYDIQEEE